jgi:hypothetical protein
MTGNSENIIAVGLVAVGNLVAAVFWFMASLVDVRPDLEAIVSDMHRVSELSAYAATAAVLCSIFLFVHRIRSRCRTN